MTVFKTIEELIEENNSFITAIPNNMGINLVSVKGIEYDYQEDGQIKEMKIIFIPSKEEPKQICDNCKIEISKYGCACGGEPKQETLEEVIGKEFQLNSSTEIKDEKYVYLIDKHRFKIAVNNILKWQQEQMYSENFYSDLSDKFYESKLLHDYKDDKIDYRFIRNWFIEQFKNK